MTTLIQRIREILLIGEQCRYRRVRVGEDYVALTVEQARRFEELEVLHGHRRSVA